MLASSGIAGSIVVCAGAIMGKDAGNDGGALGGGGQRGGLALGLKHGGLEGKSCIGVAKGIAERIPDICKTDHWEGADSQPQGATQRTREA